MMLKADKIIERMDESRSPDRLVIAPSPDMELLKKRGEASLDLRLGCWFSVFRSERISTLDVAKSVQDGSAPSSTKMHFVRFGEAFVLHPRSFVLGVTLEWIRLPSDLGGYVTSRSSWGRRGLIIATAVGVHPGFAGCLTLELSNVGEVPIHLYPGMQICQFFLHQADSIVQGTENDDGRFVGKRRPLLGSISTLQDPIFEKLAQIHIRKAGNASMGDEGGGVKQRCFL